MEVEGSLTPEELVEALPADQPRLVVHELSFASPDGTRRNAQLLIFWMPPDASEQEETYAADYCALNEYLAGVRVHLIARRADHLGYDGWLPWPADERACTVGRTPSCSGALFRPAR